jgi:hypothetical protein
MPCDEIAARLAGPVDDLPDLTPAEHTHLAACLRCQAEVARERRLQRTLTGLRDVVIAPPDDLLQSVLVHLDEQAEPRGHPRARKAAWVGGIAAATAAAAGGAIVLAARSRRHRLALAG